MIVRRFLFWALLLGRATPLVAQDSLQWRGTPAPALVRAVNLTTPGALELFNSIKLEYEGELGQPSSLIRILSSWGESAGLDCGCLTTRIYVAINGGPDDMRVYQLPDLLEPSIEPPRVEAGNPVFYVVYGRPQQRHRIRVEATRDRVLVTASPAQ